MITNYNDSSKKQTKFSLKLVNSIIKIFNLKGKTLCAISKIALTIAVLN